ncbi:MAG: PadR family transcriptional regulator [archaeon]
MAKNTPQVLSMKGFLAFQILHELKKHSRCGDELADFIGGKKGSKLTPGTIYPTLKFLRKHKLVTRKKNGRKKDYSLTDKGKEEYNLFKKDFVRIFKEIR